LTKKLAAAGDLRRQRTTGKGRIYLITRLFCRILPSRSSPPGSTRAVGSCRSAASSEPSRGRIRSVRGLGGAGPGDACWGDGHWKHSTRS
jgi:hypothetical protein